MTLKIVSDDWKLIEKSQQAPHQRHSRTGKVFQAGRGPTIISYPDELGDMVESMVYDGKELNEITTRILGDIKLKRMYTREQIESAFGDALKAYNEFIGETRDMRTYYGEPIDLRD